MRRKDASASTPVDWRGTTPRLGALTYCGVQEPLLSGNFRTRATHKRFARYSFSHLALYHKGLLWARKALPRRDSDPPSALLRARKPHWGRIALDSVIATRQCHPDVRRLRLSLQTIENFESGSGAIPRDDVVRLANEHRTSPSPGGRARSSRYARVPRQGWLLDPPSFWLRLQSTSSQGQGCAVGRRIISGLASVFTHFSADAFLRPGPQLPVGFDRLDVAAVAKSRRQLKTAKRLCNSYVLHCEKICSLRPTPPRKPRLPIAMQTLKLLSP